MDRPQSFLSVPSGRSRDGIVETTAMSTSETFHDRASRPTSPHNVTSPAQWQRPQSFLSVPSGRSRGGITDEAALKPDLGSEQSFERENNPFAFTPGQMTKLLNPKSLAAFHALGGIAGLEKGLCTDHTSAHVEHNSNRRVSNQQATVDTSSKSYSDQQAAATFAGRAQIFEEIVLPERKPKSILQLMWLAYNDKILILLTAAAVFGLTCSVYLGSAVDDGFEWLEGVAVILAILIVVTVGAVNDWQKERQFAKLNKLRAIKSDIHLPTRLTELNLESDFQLRPTLDGPSGRQKMSQLSLNWRGLGHKLALIFRLHRHAVTQGIKRKACLESLVAHCLAIVRKSSIDNARKYMPWPGQDIDAVVARGSFRPAKWSVKKCQRRLKTHNHTHADAAGHLVQAVPNGHAYGHDISPIHGLAHEPFFPTNICPISQEQLAVAAHRCDILCNRHPATSRLYGHLATLERPRLRALRPCAKSLTWTIPFHNARDSLSSLCGSIVQDEQSIRSSSFSVEARVAMYHALLHSRTDQQTLDTVMCDALHLLQQQLPRSRHVGAYLAITNIAALFGLGSSTNMLAQQHVLAIHRALHQQASNTIATKPLGSTQLSEVKPADFGTHLAGMIFPAGLEDGFASVAHYLNQAISNFPLTECHFPSATHATSDHEGIATLPEDNLLRGLRWSENHFPADWFSNESSDGPQHTEQAPSHEASTERVPWSGLDPAFHLEPIDHSLREDRFTSFGGTSSRTSIAQTGGPGSSQLESPGNRWIVARLRGVGRLAQTLLFSLTWMRLMQCVQAAPISMLELNETSADQSEAPASIMDWTGGTVEHRTLLVGSAVLATGSFINVIQVAIRQPERKPKMSGDLAFGFSIAAWALVETHPPLTDLRNLLLALWLATESNFISRTCCQVSNGRVYFWATTASGLFASLFLAALQSDTRPTLASMLVVGLPSAAFFVSCAARTLPRAVGRG